MAYTNRTCAIAWAQQNKSRGKTGNGSMSFNGPTLYSYSTPIGRFVYTSDGERVVLVNADRYCARASSQHILALWGAIDYGQGQFDMSFAVPRISDCLTNEDHYVNLAHLIAYYDTLVAKAKQRWLWRQGVKDGWLTEAADAVRDYANVFGLVRDRVFDVNNDSDAIAAHWDARFARANAPAAAEKRERARVARARRKERKEQEAREGQPACL